MLTFWLMGGGMKLLGVGDEGGYSGEMATNPRVGWALRLPFALFGCADPGVEVFAFTFGCSQPQQHRLEGAARRRAWGSAFTVGSSRE